MQSFEAAYQIFKKRSPERSWAFSPKSTIDRKARRLESFSVFFFDLVPDPEQAGQMERLKFHFSRLTDNKQPRRDLFRVVGQYPSLHKRDFCIILDSGRLSTRFPIFFKTFFRASKTPVFRALNVARPVLGKFQGYGFFRRSQYFFLFFIFAVPFSVGLILAGPVKRKGDNSHPAREVKPFFSFFPPGRARLPVDYEKTAKSPLKGGFLSAHLPGGSALRFVFSGGIL